MSDRTGSRYHRELVLVFVLLFYVLMTSPQPLTGLSQISPTTVIHPPSLVNARRSMFAQQESNSCWLLFSVDMRASTGA